MCGICGFVDTSLTDGTAILATMNATLAHRGPDGEGNLHAPPAHLAMRRLAVVDHETGRQPVSNEDGRIHAVFNGEIYNHIALRRDLIARGHRFTSDHSDSETIVHLYEEYGDDWPRLARVNGMFSVALWDQRRQRLLLLRDRMGKKPLYWARLPGGLVFASEPKAVLAHPQVARTVDVAALWHYFSLKSVPAPLSGWQGIEQLPPGSRLVWQDGRIETDQWWSPDFTPAAAETDEAEAAHGILSRLDDAVGLRLEADVPVGILLSGGLDSSAVATLASRRGGRLKTFCLGYADLDGAQRQGKESDAFWSRELAARLGSDHHQLCLSASDFIAGLPQVMHSFDQPFSGTISTFYLAAFMRPAVTAALSGDGADELFGSYLAHRLAQPMARYLADPASRTVDNRAALAPFDQPQQFALLQRLADPDQAQWRMGLTVFSEADKLGLFSQTALDAKGAADSGHLYRSYLAGQTAQDSLNAALELDQRSLLPDQVLAFADRLSMAHGLEIRSPFLDHRLVEFVNALPGSIKIKNGRVKHILKQSLTGLLPPDLIDRPKEGFVQPVYTWMKGPLRPWLESLLTEDRLGSHGLLRPDTVQGLLRQHFAGTADHGAKLWSLACFQLWYETMAAPLVRP